MNTVHNIVDPRHPVAPKIGDEHHVSIEDAVHLAGLTHGVLYSATSLLNRLKDLADHNDHRSGGPGPHGITGAEPASHFMNEAKGDLVNVATYLRLHHVLADMAEKRFNDLLREAARRGYEAGCQSIEYHEEDCQEVTATIMRDVTTRAGRRAS